MAGKIKTSEQLTKIYDYIMTKFANSGIIFIMFYGSLLGYIRSENFIENDDDVDVLMSRSQHEALMDFVKLNKIKTGIVKNDIIQLYSDIDGPFDIYLYDEIKDDILIKWGGNILHRKSDMFPLIQINFKNHNIYIPCHPETIIIEIYGQEWRTPKDKRNKYVQWAGNPRRL